MQLEDGYRSIFIYRLSINFSAVCTSDFGRIEHLKILLKSGGIKIRDLKTNLLLFYTYIFYIINIYKE